MTIFTTFGNRDMTEARDIAGIGIPFAAGVAAGMVLLPVLPARTVAFCTPGLLAAAGFFLLLYRTRWPFPALRGAVAGIFLLAGIFCAANGALTGGPWSGTPEGWAAAAAGRLKDAIDAIPYSSETHRALVKALLTGDRSGLGREVTATFRTSGAAHLLALSGLHLGVLYLLFVRLTLPLGNSRPARILRYAGILSAAGFYVCMTGSSPSIVRAFLFILLNETCRLTGRERQPVRVLLAALTLQLAFRPDVVSSVGFQLSYLAMTGIFLLEPVLESWYPASGSPLRDRWNPMRKIWKGASLTLSCQLFTAPVVWFRFHTFPKYFLLTNLIAMPLTSGIMLLSVLTIVLSACGICPAWLVALDDRAVALLLDTLGIISRM